MFAKFYGPTGPEASQSQAFTLVAEMNGINYVSPRSWLSTSHFCLVPAIVCPCCHLDDASRARSDRSATLPPYGFASLLRDVLQHRICSNVRAIRYRIFGQGRLLAVSSTWNPFSLPTSNPSYGHSSIHLRHKMPRRQVPIRRTWPSYGLHLHNLGGFQRLWRGSNRFDSGSEDCITVFSTSERSHYGIQGVQGSRNS